MTHVDLDDRAPGGESKALLAVHDVVGDAEVTNQVLDALEALGQRQDDPEVGRDSWAQLMRLLDEHYPADVFVGGPDADSGPRIVALVREVDRLRNERCCTQCGDGDLYPRRCSQCGQRWADMACGPTHAVITEELGIGDLRREAAGLQMLRSYLAEQLGHRDGEVPPDEELLFRAAYWIKEGLRWAVERRDEPGRALTKEELLEEFAKREAGDG